MGKPDLAPWLYTRRQRHIRVAKGFSCFPFGGCEHLREERKLLAQRSRLVLANASTT
ncbi:BgTH12-06910 [Blumeria graminis f. sp. triticale]|uniref:BgTH12-06910 n=1 Tax=Blumeria graminis f. sp. triticale TaxID=1689686 RepID=A0A9W4D895_BLUGR|nr:BgTH12-06910 [Blumeria graminis f. sp. triticale]